jgi:UDP-glucose 4-epimerase
MQKVLIVGGAGFIGRHTARRLAEVGATVYATHTPGKRPPWIAGVRWLSCDLTAADATVGWPAGCDAVISLAQARNWRTFPQAARDVFAVNVAGLVQTLQYAQRTGVRRFVYASSGSVYTQTARPALENEVIDLPAPRTFYVASKLAAEVLLRPYQALFPVVVLRLFMPYGAGQNPDMLLPSLVERVRQGQPLKLHGQDGLVSNPVAAADVAEALARCLTLDNSVTLNVGGPERLTLRQVGQAIGRVVGCEPAFESQPAAAVPVVVGDTTALQKTLGWAPALRMEEGLRRWLDEELAQGAAA